MVLTVNIVDRYGPSVKNENMENIDPREDADSGRGAIYMMSLAIS